MPKDKSTKRFLKRFGLNMRHLREQKGWTLEYTEEQGWPDWTHLQKVESGKKDIKLSTLQRLSKLYKMPIPKLFEGM